MKGRAGGTILRVLFVGLLSVAQARAGATGEAVPIADREPGEVTPTAADYRVRSETTNLEVITPAFLRSLREGASPSAVVGEAPWQWQRLDSLPEGTVVLQVVPDLRWTGGSYARVTGRVVSYPILAGVVVGGTLILAMIAVLGGGNDIPELITPSAPLWKPVHASYHHRGDFLDATLLRDGVEIPAIEGQRICDKAKVWMARKPGRKPRWRTIRGCWGSYAYPADAFGPGATLEVRLRDQGKEEEPRIVPIPEGLVARVHADPRGAEPVAVGWGRAGAQELVCRAAVEGNGTPAEAGRCPPAHQ